MGARHNNYDRDYNIEDTGKLMTEARSGLRGKRLIFIIAAVVAVAVIAAYVGMQTIQDRKYDAQIVVADKYFAEGNYEQAEVEYLAAVGMNKRNSRAREGLAYVYAVQGKTEESVRTYTELYEETQEEKYREAADAVSEGRMPYDADLIPAHGMWRTVEAEMIPLEPSLAVFLQGLDQDMVWQEEKLYDCTDPDFNVMTEIVMTGYFRHYHTPAEYLDDLDEMESQPELGEWFEGHDPRGLNVNSDEYDMYEGYERYEAAKMDWVLTDIFNLHQGLIDLELKQGGSYEQVYKEDGYYYCTYGWPTGIPERAIEINSYMTDGQKICVSYDAGELDTESEDYDVFSIDRSYGYDTLYALVELKKIDGMHYWSVYYVGPDMPEEVRAAMQSQNTGGGETSAGGDANKAAKNAFAGILRENESAIRTYWVDDCVCLTDIDGDGIDEMMYMYAENEYDARLVMWSYDPDAKRAVEFTPEYQNGYMYTVSEINYFRDVQVAGGTKYMIYLGKEPGTMYIVDVMSDDFVFYRMSCFRLDGPGKMTEISCVEDYYTPDESHEHWTDDYHINGSEVSSQEGIAGFKKGNTDYKELIMSYGSTDALSVFRHADTDAPLALTFDEALRKLEN